MFWPPCTPVGKDCVVDGWTMAGFAGTVLGVAATVLALLGAFAVAAWWTGPEERVKKLVEGRLAEQQEQFNKEVQAMLATQQSAINRQVQKILADQHKVVAATLAAERATINQQLRTMLNQTSSRQKE